MLTESEFIEFVRGELDERPTDISQDLHAAFIVFDKDNDGNFTKEKKKT